MTVVRRRRGRVLLLCCTMLFTRGAQPFPPPAAGAPVSISVPVAAGWNLLSLPLLVTDGATGTVFPSSLSDAIIFDGGYTNTDTLRTGPGFWLKFAAPETVVVTGAAVVIDSIPLRQGWNLVGGVSTPIAAAFVETAPQGLLTSKFFRYRPGSGFSQVDTLWPGAGYWVKTGAAGLLRMMSRDVPCPGSPTVEAGGKSYETVQIGNQCWFRRNLDTGERVNGVSDQQDNGVIEKYCFNDEPVNCTFYGGLYQWGEAMQYGSTGGPRGICPEGWHVPTREDFAGLISSVDGDGNALKALRQGVGEGIGTNTSGFSALLTGYRHLDGSFSIQGYMAYMRTSTDTTAGTALSVYFFAQYPDVYILDNDREYGFGVRCLRDWAGETDRSRERQGVRDDRF